MIVICFLFMFLSTLYLPLRCSRTEPPLSGPFRTTVIGIKDCSHPTKPYAKNPAMVFNSWVQNSNGKNYMNGNYTIFKDIKDFKMKMKNYIWRNGKWQQSHLSFNLDCHSMLLHITMAAIKASYDQKSCMFLKGSYTFNNLDANYLHHIWVSTTPYGRTMWRFEFVSKEGTSACKEYDTITEPAHD